MKNYLSDTMTLANRLIKHNLRSMDTIITVVAMPVAMLLMFIYILGGSMQLPGVSHGEYVNYILPAILFMTLATGSAYTALRVFMDKSSGMFDRFKSMPIAKSAVLNGQVVSSVLFLMFSTVIVLLISFLTGFRAQANLGQWLLTFILVIGFAIMVTWLSVPFGLAAKSIDSASAFSYLLLLLLFVSSGFSSVEGMPTPVRVFAEHQPMTTMITAVRQLLAGQNPTADFWQSIVWIIGITLVSFFFSKRLYHQI
ncbi:ABC transporter permease [Lapidilactobacillus mulanensis]|uniref:Transport permease protein n=1 Tax=Lapidilactobacillus mulanensis TaxID=2485999 RepID=A0ABW4DPS4_9LACO|nr:ABC transporter permease [Lapidilactobacillus mulanensis]